MSSIAVQHGAVQQDWHPPSRGMVGMYSLIVAESAMFTIFVVAYIYYLGKIEFGPTPRVLEVPVLATICLLSSSATIWLAERALEAGKKLRFRLWWALTFLLGAYFITQTGREWHRLIYHDGLTIRSNLFGTTFYSLVGLHATHVVVGLTLLLLVFLLSLSRGFGSQYASRIKVLSLYWHFVDAVWVVVFTVVYLIGR